MPHKHKKRPTGEGVVVARPEGASQGAESDDDDDHEKMEAAYAAVAFVREALVDRGMSVRDIERVAPAFGVDPAMVHSIALVVAQGMAGKGAGSARELTDVLPLNARQKAFSEALRAVALDDIRARSAADAVCVAVLPAEQRSAVEVRVTGASGRGLYAARGFEPGEVLLTDAALLCVEGTAGGLLDLVARGSFHAAPGGDVLDVLAQLLQLHPGPLSLAPPSADAVETDARALPEREAPAATAAASSEAVEAAAVEPVEREAVEAQAAAVEPVEREAVEAQAAAVEPVERVAEWLEAILTNNSFTFPCPEGTPRPPVFRPLAPGDLRSGAPPKASVVFRTASLLNHSCRPNAFVLLDWRSTGVGSSTPQAAAAAASTSADGPPPSKGSAESATGDCGAENSGNMFCRVVAARPIAPGEEVTIEYMPVANARSERLEFLERFYGFRCSCERCAAACDDAIVLRCQSCKSGRVVGHSSACADCGDDVAAPKMAMYLTLRQRLLVGLTEALHLAQMMRSPAAATALADKFAQASRVVHDADASMFSFMMQAISMLATSPAVPAAADRAAYLQRIIAALPLVRPLLAQFRVVTVLSEIGLALCPDSPEGQCLASGLFSEAADIVERFNPRNVAFVELLRRLAASPPLTRDEAAAAEVACSQVE